MSKSTSEPSNLLTDESPGGLWVGVGVRGCVRVWVYVVCVRVCACAV